MVYFRAFFSFIFLFSFKTFYFLLFLFLLFVGMHAYSSSSVLFARMMRVGVCSYVVGCYVDTFFVVVNKLNDLCLYKNKSHLSHSI